MDANMDMDTDCIHPKSVHRLKLVSESDEREQYCYEHGYETLI